MNKTEAIDFLAEQEEVVEFLEETAREYWHRSNSGDWKVRDYYIPMARKYDAIVQLLRGDNNAKSTGG